MAFEIENGILKNYIEEDGVTEVVIPDGVTEIGYNAFKCCRQLTNINIPDSVTVIDSCAFYSCSSLMSINIPDGVTKISRGTFKSCSSLSTINIPDSITKIDETAFEGCSFFTIFNYSTLLFNAKIIVSPNISLSEYQHKTPAIKGFLLHPEINFGRLFNEYCSFFTENYKKFIPFIAEKDIVPALSILADTKKITVRNYEDEFLKPLQEAKAVGCLAFLMDWINKNITNEQRDEEFDRQLNKDSYNATDMRKLWKYSILDNGGICIKEYKGTDTSVVIPERIGKRPVTEIGCYAFIGCSALTTINIPNSVTEIGGWAFCSCSSLTTINIPDSVTVIGDLAFKCCSSLTTINIPASVTKIGEEVFNRCSSLATINIPGSVTEIGRDAFEYCSALNVHTPSGSFADKYFREHLEDIKEIIND